MLRLKRWCRGDNLSTATPCLTPNTHTPSTDTPMRNVECYSTSITVRTYELDMLGHVNNAVYLNWLEQGRLAAVEEMGYKVRFLSREWLTNVVRVEIDYRRPAFYGDELEVRTALDAIGRTSVTLRSWIVRLPQEELVAEAVVVLVWLRHDGRPKPLPGDFEQEWRSNLPTKAADE